MLYQRRVWFLLISWNHNVHFDFSQIFTPSKSDRRDYQLSGTVHGAIRPNPHRLEELRHRLDTIGGKNLDHTFAATRNKEQVIKILAFASHDLTPVFVRSLTLHIENISLSLLTGVGLEKQGEIFRSVQKIRIKRSSFGQPGVLTLL